MLRHLLQMPWHLVYHSVTPYNSAASRDVFLIHKISYIECFHSRGQHLCKFIGTKEKCSTPRGLVWDLGHQHGRRFIVLGHQYGRRDVMWKHYNSSLQICMAGRMHFSKKKKQNDMFFSNWNKKPDEEKIYRWTEFFHKLDNDKWKMHTGARARKQKYIYIYISLHMKTFLKTAVYISINVFLNLRWRLQSDLNGIWYILILPTWQSFFLFQ